MLREQVIRRMHDEPNHITWATCLSRPENRGILTNFLWARRWHALVQAITEADYPASPAFDKAVNLWRLPPEDDPHGKGWEEYARRNLIRILTEPAENETTAVERIPFLARSAESHAMLNRLAPAFWTLGAGILLPLICLPIFWYGGGFLDRVPCWLGIILWVLVMVCLVVGVLSPLAIPIGLGLLIHRLATQHSPAWYCRQIALRKTTAEEATKALFCRRGDVRMAGLSSERDLWAEPPAQMECQCCQSKVPTPDLARTTVRLTGRLFRCLHCGQVFCDAHFGGFPRADTAGNLTLPDPYCPFCDSAVNVGLWYLDPNRVLLRSSAGGQELDSNGAFLRKAVIMGKGWRTGTQRELDPENWTAVWQQILEHETILLEAAEILAGKFGLGRGESLEECILPEWKSLCARHNPALPGQTWFHHVEPVFTGPVSTRWCKEEIERFHLEPTIERLCRNTAAKSLSGTP